MTSNTPLFTHTEKLLSMIPGNSSTSRVDMEKLLREVHKEDKIIVSNVIQTMQVLRNYEFLTNFEVIKNKKGYDVVGTRSRSRLSVDILYRASISYPQENTMVLKCYLLIVYIEEVVFMHTQFDTSK